MGGNIGEVEEWIRTQKENKVNREFGLLFSILFSHPNVIFIVILRSMKSWLLFNARRPPQKQPETKQETSTPFSLHHHPLKYKVGYNIS